MIIFRRDMRPGVESNCFGPLLSMLMNDSPSTKRMILWGGRGEQLLASVYGQLCGRWPLLDTRGLLLLLSAQPH